jgi:hypothetical protein
LQLKSFPRSKVCFRHIAWQPGVYGDPQYVLRGDTATGALACWHLFPAMLNTTYGLAQSALPKVWCIPAKFPHLELLAIRYQFPSAGLASGRAAVKFHDTKQCYVAARLVSTITKVSIDTG